MAVLIPEQLFEQAEHLTKYRPPTQEDLRRALSACYYDIFHLICTDAADLFAGKMQRRTATYAVVYRSVDHGQLRKVCLAVQSPDDVVKAVILAGELRSKLVKFAAATVRLQNDRNLADYDPMRTYSITDARAAIDSARDAHALYQDLKAEKHTINRSAFLMLLMFKRR